MSSITARLAAAKAAAKPSNLATGMASSVDSTAAIAHLMAPPEEAKDPESSEDCETKDCTTVEVDIPTGAYLFINLKRLIKNNGQVVKPDVYGLYVPKDEEEEDQLAWFEKQGLDWVKKVG